MEIKPGDIFIFKMVQDNTLYVEKVLEVDKLGRIDSKMLVPHQNEQSYDDWGEFINECEYYKKIDNPKIYELLFKE